MQEVSMKKLLAVAIATTILSGCSTIPNPFADNDKFIVNQPSENWTAVQYVKVGVVNDEGIKIYYTLLGDLDRIEVYGFADAWKGNVEIVAELDAKERLVKYLYDEKVDTDRSVEIITKTLDKARDSALNRIENGLDPQTVVEFSEEQIEQEVEGENQATVSQNLDTNTSRRTAERIEATKIRALTRITSGGSLRAMRKVGSEVRNDGKTYIAVYEWSEKGQDTANQIRRKMFAK